MSYRNAKKAKLTEELKDGGAKERAKNNRKIQSSY